MELLGCVTQCDVYILWLACCCSLDFSNRVPTFERKIFLFFIFFLFCPLWSFQIRRKSYSKKKISTLIWYANRFNLKTWNAKKKKKKRNLNWREEIFRLPLKARHCSGRDESVQLCFSKAFSFRSPSARCCSNTAMLMTQQRAAACHYFAPVLSVPCQSSVPTRHPRLSWIIQARCFSKPPRVSQSPGFDTHFCYGR